MNTDKTGLILWRSTTSSRAEAKVCSWQAVTEQDLETNIWRAYIRHLPEGERISSREMFRARGDAELWCRAEIGQRCQVVRFAYRMERPKLSAELRRKILNTLRRYNTLTTQALVVETLREWGLTRARILLASEEYRDWPEEWLSEEPGHYLWLTLNEMDYSTSHNRVSRGTIALDYPQVRQHASRWVEQLAPMPFYETIYAYCIAAYNWLETCDLQPFLRNAKSERDAIKVCLDKWKLDLDVY